MEDQVNKKLKGAIIGLHGTLWKGAAEAGLNPSRLSALLRGRIPFTDKDRQALTRILGRETFRRVLGEEKRIDSL
jgi:hypothetical protein